MKPSITFVSAFLDLSEDRSKDKSAERCFGLFENLAKSEINICLFVSQTFYQNAQHLCTKYSNIYLMPVIELNDLWTYQVTKQFEVTLPDNKLSHHDTFNFMVLMNAKIEFVEKAMIMNPFNTNHFAWIDFSICHVIQSEQSLKRLYTFSQSALKDKMLAFPVCYSKNYLDKQYHNLYTSVLWRFCGGFFVGDRESLFEFNECYKMHYERFLREGKRLIWEVNFWAWLEKNRYFHPEGWPANHNDTIIKIPSEYLKTIACLTAIPPRFERCKSTIRSLLNQVEHIYLSVSRYYVRFGLCNLPDFLNEEDFKGRVTVVETIDFGPATKYLGAISKIPENYWVIFCDDDQIYTSNLVHKMKQSIEYIAAYQNSYYNVICGSGGIIHGFVGNMFHRSLLNKLETFDLPYCSRFVDDQWMSIYCFKNDISIYPTIVNSYDEIYKVLRDGYEQIGEAPLAALGNRDSKVAELANHFKVRFIGNGQIENISEEERV